MKVLFLSSWYPTKGNPNFGIFIKEHAHSIKVAGNDIVVLAIVISFGSKIYSKTISDYEEDGIRNVVIEINTRFKNLMYYLIPLQYLIVKRTYIKLIQPIFEPDIVHSNVIFPSGIIGHLLSQKIKKSHIITEHWSRIKSLIQKPILSTMAQKAYKNASYILPVSNFLKNNIVSILPDIETNKFIIVGNVIDSEIFYYKKKEKTDTIRFCAIATWANKKIPDKMPEIFIDALSQLKTKTNCNIVLTMIGGGDKTDELKELCFNKGIEAKFLGYRTKTEIAQQLQKCDFFVHSSSIETFGVVVAEALFCGTPVICSNVGALPELINASNGILSENTVDAWVNSISKAIKTTFLNEEISANIKDKFSLTSIGNKINQVYDKLEQDKQLTKIK